MRSFLKPLRVLLFIVPLAMSGFVFAGSVDDEVPDVTDRVARISFLVGEAQIRRDGETEWENVVLNLPLVEGDELATTPGARFEIQFNSSTFVRVDGASLIRVVTLKDDGIAISISEGAASIRLNSFDKDRSFFEIDMPRTTISVQSAGLYRVDAGAADSSEARIRITDGGEARIYSDTSGFTLRNGRAATVYLSGDNAGEWQTTDAGLYSDEFDSWSLDRDAVAAKRLKDAYYDKYYDRDIYGAEELSDHGEWIYTRSYGYVWRPYRTATSVYSDWSPYRYGHWRWIPPFGWTWVNDEPWGWATYHYGRWIWDSGYWVWTPYGYYRYRRSWWSPALVFITVYNNNVCWYPLGYRHRYYNYNRYYGRRHSGAPGGGGATTPAPTPGPTQAEINAERTRRMHTPPLSNVPPGGVVTTPIEQFGRDRRGVKRPPLQVAREILAKDPGEVRTPPILPPFEQVSRTVSKEIRADTPPIIQTDRRVRTGAAERKSDRPMDEELRKTKIFGNRVPVPMESIDRTVRTGLPPSQQEPRNTGAVQRPTKPRGDVPATPPIYVPPQKSDDTRTEPRKPVQPSASPRPDVPVYVPPRRSEPPPTYVPPKRDDPPPRSEPPKRSDPPKREASPPKSDPPADRKPAPPLGGERKKDG